MVKISKVISVFVTITLLETNGIKVYAYPYENIEKDSTITENNSQLTLDDVLQKIQDDDSKIESKIEDVNIIKQQIYDKEKEIEEEDAKIKEAEKSIEEKDRLLAYRMHQLQSDGGIGFTNLKYLDALLSSRNLLEIVQNINMINNICRNDKKMFKEAQEAKYNLCVIKNNKEEENEELKENRSKLESEIKDIETDKSELLSYLNDNNNLLSQDAVSIVPITLPNDISENAKALIDEAQKYLGTPYRWGGTTPMGFDCSGYMQYVYACEGISLPRVSQEQQRYSKAISMSEIKPGDLVFNKAADSTHVGMYVGDDKYIHAPHTGDIIKISTLSTSNMKYAGRVLE